VPDVYGNPLDDDWSEDQITTVVQLVQNTCAELSKRESIPAEEIEGWNLIDGQGVFARGYPAIPTQPVIQLGEAIIALLNNALPKAPLGTRWWYGIEDQPSRIRSG
jgi:hypothetical protein